MALICNLILSSFKQAIKVSWLLKISDISGVEVRSMVSENTRSFHHIKSICSHIQKESIIEQIYFSNYVFHSLIPALCDF